jgi:hypothetical protein
MLLRRSSDGRASERDRRELECRPAPNRDRPLGEPIRAPNEYPGGGIVHGNSASVFVPSDVKLMDRSSFGQRATLTAVFTVVMEHNRPLPRHRDGVKRARTRCHSRARQMPISTLPSC